MIKAILVDIDNTLLDFDVCSKRSMQEACERMGMTYTQEMYDAFMRINEKLWLQIEQGTLTKERLHEIRWNMVFEKIGQKADGVLFETYFCEALNVSSEPIEGAADLLRYLSQKYVVAVASNASHNQQAQRMALAGMHPYVRYYFVSSQIGVEKPQKGFFQYCLHTLELAPQEVLILGDSLTADMQGGLNCGLHTCWYNPHRKPVPDDMPLDYVVSSLAEVKRIL